MQARQLESGTRARVQDRRQKKCTPRREFAQPERKGPTMCRRRGAVHLNKRWTLAFGTTEMPAGYVADTLCPGCVALQSGRVDGVVVLEVAWPQQRVSEILRLLQHVERHEREKNSLSRIASLVVRPRRVEIHTTTDFLAGQLGRAVEKACGGSLHIQHLPGEKFARVHWEPAR